MTSLAQEVLEECKVSLQEKRQVIDSIVLLMKGKYVFPGKGEEIGQLVLINLKEGKDDEISNPQDFANALTNDLQSVNNDKHIGVRYAPEMIAIIRKEQKDKTNEEMEEYMKRQQEHINFKSWSYACGFQFIIFSPTTSKE